MKKLIDSIKYWGQLLLLPIYWFSFLIPRNKNIWLFGSTFGRRFADNPRYFYLYIAQKKSHSIRPIWISHNKRLVKELTLAGYEAYWYKSLKGIWFCLRGKVYLFDNYSKDISFCLSGGAIKVNLWHGIPLKKIQNDNQYDKVRHPKTKWEKLVYLPRTISDEKASHYILSPSPYFAPIFSSAFATKRVLICGYPRCDSFTSHSVAPFLLQKEQKYMERLQHTQANKVILYMPTFRETETKFFEVVDGKKLSAFLEQHNYFLCIKLHPKSNLQERFRRLNSKHIVLMDSDTDPYPWIPYSDALITDYSSIYFDYLLTSKPILFFCYDLEAYLAQSRKMYFPFEAMTPGKKVRTLQELEEALTDWNTLLRESKSQTSEWIKQYAFGKHPNSVSCPFLYQKIKNLL